MTPFTTALAVLPLGQDIPDPEDVTAGGVGALVLGLLFLAVLLLVLSFRRHLKKVRFEQPSEETTANGDADEGGSSRP